VDEDQQVDIAFGVRNALELTPVVRHEDQSVTERDGSNLEIVRANDHAAKFQLVADFGTRPSTGIVERQ